MRQIKEVEDVMARNAHWNPRSEPVTDRLAASDAKLPDAQIRERLLPIDYMDQPLWYERINWRFIGIVVGFVALDLAVTYVAIRACEAFAKFTEAI